MTLLVFLTVLLVYVIIQTCFLLFAFYCGYIWGRHKISAYEWWKRKLKEEEL